MHTSYFLYYVYGHHPDLYSFPTRRSSDLLQMRICEPGAAASTASWMRVKPALGQSNLSSSTTICGALTATVGRAENSEKTDRKSTRLNSSHLGISYAVFCLKKKKKKNKQKTKQRNTRKKNTRPEYHKKHNRNKRHRQNTTDGEVLRIQYRKAHNNTEVRQD